MGFLDSVFLIWYAKETKTTRTHARVLLLAARLTRPVVLRHILRRIECIRARASVAQLIGYAQCECATFSFAVGCRHPLVRFVRFVSFRYRRTCTINMTRWLLIIS